MRNIFAFILLLSFLFLQTNTLFAQGGELDEQKKIHYRNERTLAFSLNSNGWGMDYRYAKQIHFGKQWFYDAGFNVMKHPKEQKTVQESLSFRRYVYGKDNYVFNLQLAIGRQNQIFRKRDKGSVSIRTFYSAGTTLAVIKPMYYEVLVDDYTIHKRYDPAMQSVYIIGRSPFIMGVQKLPFYLEDLLKVVFHLNTVSTTNAYVPLK